VRPEAIAETSIAPAITTIDPAPPGILASTRARHPITSAAGPNTIHTASAMTPSAGSAPEYPSESQGPRPITWAVCPTSEVVHEGSAASAPSAIENAAVSCRFMASDTATTARHGSAEAFDASAHAESSARRAQATSNRTTRRCAISVATQSTHANAASSAHSGTACRPLAMGSKPQLARSAPMNAARERVAGGASVDARRATPSAVAADRATATSRTRSSMGSPSSGAVARSKMPSIGGCCGIGHGTPCAAPHA
jgi:hypothetical protein